MICVSSSEYPETDLYKKTVLQAGGSLNAVTVGEKTSFYFELPSFSDANTTEEPIFSTVLKIFSSYFKSPLFDNKYTNREINAIDSEHTNNRAALNKLTFHGLRLLANKEHPFNRFSTGNFHTLHDILQEKGLNIRDELVKFYQNEYISSRMSLVIRGPASLNKLQKLAVESFSTIPSQNATQSNIIRDYWLPKYKSDAFGEHQKGKIILIDRNTTHPLLRLIFPLNEHHINGNQNRKNTEMYMNLFCSILGDESETSVNTILYKLNYIIEVMTLTPEISCENNMLELQLTLSSLGTKNIDKILTILFDYVQKTFQQNDKNTRRVAKLISQFNSIELYNFLYEDVNQEAANECRGLSSLLLNDLEGTLRWLIKGSPCWDHSDDGYKGGYGESDAAKSWWTRKAAEISSLMSQTVTPANMIISYISPESNFKFIQCLDCLPVEFQEDQHFGFRYKICDIKFKPTPYEGEIRLPRPNPFCPQTAEDQTNLLKILEDASQDSIASSLLCPKNNSNNATNPILISSEDGYQLWVKRETSLASKDKAFLSLELTNTRMKPSATNSLCMEILLDLVIQNLREILYPSLELRYSYDLFPSLKGDVGVIIHISGPINKLYSILLLIITEIKNISSTFDELVKSERFRKARVRLKLKCEALNNIPSYEVASLGLMVVLEEYTWSLEDRLQYLEELDFQTVAHFSKHAFDSCYVSSLLQGDVNDSDYSLNIVPVLQKLVGTFEAEHYHYPSTVLLPKSANLKILGASPDETNALVYYVQTGIRDNLSEKQQEFI
ncbi:hypothetical protein CANARDRAFT_175990 [[Candida] arabinofermentans NRRL YB-2248]|uniref:Peptidase M16 middle/third domain-containing protein n=1 Tax=[Candida] arabinofermentans NRRL YB-2248 TaxID=983967 RepID=A0A1E4T1A4_9ASCO|nr:hypothetical protein CANARDRAFT_175990 [[Candida] arabinofermentans NRRL YB-2248]